VSMMRNKRSEPTPGNSKPLPLRVGPMAELIERLTLAINRNTEAINRNTAAIDSIADIGPADNASTEEDESAIKRYLDGSLIQ
jgi:hypothetical protein